MKRVVLFMLLFSVPVCHGQILAQILQRQPAPTPGFVNETSKNSTLTNALGNNPTGQTACSNFSYCIPYADPTLSGNIGIVSGHFANSTTLTPTASDDKSDTYTCTTGGFKDTGTNEWPYICYSLNVASGAHKVTTTYGTTAVTQVTEKAAQFNNIATASALDGSIGSCAGTSSSTANCASVSPTQANDLIYVFVCRAGTPAVTSFTAGTGFTLLTADINDGCASEWEVDSGTGSITPSMTMASASTYVEIVAAFKSATAGTAPSGWYTRRMESWSSPSVANNTTLSFQLPGIGSGDLLFMSNSCGSLTPGTPSETANTWTQVGSTNSSPSVILNEFYVPNAASDSSGLISYVGTTGSSGDCTTTLYDTVGAPSSVVVGQGQFADAPTTAAATLPWLWPPDSAISNNTNALWFYPVPSSGMVFTVGGQAFNTTVGINKPSSGCVFDDASFGGMSLSGPEPIDENNTWSHCLYSGGAAGQFIFNEASSTLATNTWRGDVDGVWGVSGAIGIIHAASNVSTSGTTLAVTVPSTIAGNLLVVTTGAFNGPTVSKVCLDGSTCAAGNSFTQFTSAASTGTGHAGTDIWYLLNAPSGKTTVTVTWSSAVSNGEAEYYEVQKAGGGSWATDGAAHTTNGTGSGTTLTGPSVTTTGSADICVAIAAISGGPMSAIPGSGNEYDKSNIMFANTSDATGAAIVTTATGHAPTWSDSTSGDSFSASNGCFK